MRDDVVADGLEARAGSLVERVAADVAEIVRLEGFDEVVHGITDEIQRRGLEGLDKALR